MTTNTSSSTLSETSTQGKAKKNKTVKNAYLHWPFLFLAIGTLLSAVAIIYVKEVHRMLFLKYESLTTKKEKNLGDQEKLVLEKSQLTAQAHIQETAQTQLNMHIPKKYKIIFIDPQKKKIKSS